MILKYKNILPSDQWENELTRHAYGETLVEMGHTNDKIVVMDDGKIIEIGKHEELLKTCEKYKILYEMQFATQ